MITTQLLKTPMPQAPEFPDNYYITREALENELEGGPYLAGRPGKPAEKQWECDWCSKGISFNREVRAAFYMTDDVLFTTNPTAKQIRNERKLGQFASYCEDCAHPRLLYPCRGYTEVRGLMTIDSDREMKNVEITDISPENDGIPWDPAEVSEKITGVSALQSALYEPEHIWGPENIVTVVLATTGVDIRDLVKWDGTLDPKLLGQARRKYNDFLSKMRQGNHSSRTFSREVRRKD